MAIYDVFVRESNDINVNQDIRDIAESIKEHIEEQFGINVDIEECTNGITITFEVADRNRKPSNNAMRGEGIL